MPRVQRIPRIHRHLDPLIAEATRALAERRDAILPNDHALDVAAQVGPADFVSAADLWDEAQRRAGTGLEGLLNARMVRADG
jgi:hypothetical protein